MARRDLLTASLVILACSALSGAQDLAPPPSITASRPTDRALVADLVAANHILAAQGVLDAYGHVSVRHDRDPSRFLLSWSLAPELVTIADILEHGLDGNLLGAETRELYRERFIHAEIYRARPDVNAVVHSHSPSVIPFGVSSIPMRPLFHMAAFVGEGVPVFEIRDVVGATGMLVESPALGRALAGALGAKAAILMRGHGAAIVGPSLPVVVGRSVYLEINAKLQAQAIAMGGTITYLTPEEAQTFAAQQNYSRAWELWKRKAGER